MVDTSVENLKNVMYFDSDDDFYNYCVVPAFVFVTNTGDDVPYVTFNLSNAYNNATKNGKLFAIKDMDSQILKHGGVSYRGMFKEIPNLVRWWNFDDGTDETCQRHICDCKCKDCHCD